MEEDDLPDGVAFTDLAAVDVYGFGGCLVKRVGWDVNLFTSDRERRIWLWTRVVLAAIYASLGFAGALVRAF